MTVGFSCTCINLGGRGGHLRVRRRAGSRRLEILPLAVERLRGALLPLPGRRTHGAASGRELEAPGLAAMYAAIGGRANAEPGRRVRPCEQNPNNLRRPANRGQ